MKSKVKMFITAAAMALTIIVAPAAFASEGHEHGKDHGKEEKKTKSETAEICVVSGDKLGEMGKPYVFEYKGQEIKLCCKDCRKDFDKDPEKYMKKLEVKKEK